MRAALILAGALFAVPFTGPAFAQTSDSSAGCVSHQPVVQPGGANNEDQRYAGLRDWFGVHIANRCSQQVVAQVCIVTGTGQQQCNVMTIYPGHNDDYGFPDTAPNLARYTVNTCFQATMAAGRCGFGQDPSPFVPYYAPGDEPADTYQPPYQGNQPPNYDPPRYYGPQPDPRFPPYRGGK